MRKAGCIIDALSYISGYFSGWVVLLIISLIMVEVVTRYLLKSPLIIGDEFSGYMLVAMSFLGLAYTAMEKGHIRLTFLLEVLPARVTNLLRVITLTLFLIYAALASWVSIGFLQNTWQRGIRSSSWIRTPLFWPEISIAVGFVLLTLSLVVGVARAVKDTRAGIPAEGSAEKIREGGIE